VRKEGLADSQTEVLSRVSEMIHLSREASDKQSTAEGVATGIGRMIMWSNVVSLNYAPDSIPYRGFSDFWDEFIFLNSSTLFRDSEDYFDESLTRDFGIGGAKLLGFSVSTGGSVPFPILADGWLRAGLGGIILFAGILCFLWGLAERTIRRIYVDEPHYLIAFICILLSSSYDRMGVYGFIYNLRYLTMQLILWGTIFYFLRKVVRRRQTT
jgi:hypothetical protein